MPTARARGVNEDISTYGAGQDYTVLATWETDTDNDNVTGTVSPVLECLAGVYDDGGISIAGATNNASYFRILRPQPGSFHTGVRDTGVRFYRAVDAGVLGIGETNTQVQDIAGRTTNNSATQRAVFQFQGTSATAAMVGLIATGSLNSGSEVMVGIRGNSQGASLLTVDCLSENNDGSQFKQIAVAGAGWTLYNCTGIANGGATSYVYEAAGASTTMACKNCLAQENGTGFGFVLSAGTFTGDYCASDDTTPTTLSFTNSRVSQTFSFVDAAAFDYHLAGNDAGARRFGTDLSADATFPFNDDIDRRTRTAGQWDIGMASVNPALVFNNYLFVRGVSTGFFSERIR